MLTPVMFPPGRDMLGTRPILTGSVVIAETKGSSVAKADFAGGTVPLPPWLQRTMATLG